MSVVPEGYPEASQHIRDPFQTHPWMTACADATGGKLRKVGPHLLLERRIGPWRVAGMPLPKTGTPPIAGLVGSPGENSAALRRFDQDFRNSGLSMLQVSSLTPPPEGLGASRIQSALNLEIDLRLPCETLWSNVSSLPRRNVRKAIRSGMQVHIAPLSDEGLLRCAAMSRSIFEEAGETPIHWDAQFLALGSPELRPRVTCFIATLGGDVLGHLLSVRSEGRAYYWDVAVGARGRPLGAGHLLMWTWIRWCKRHRLAVLDLVGPPEGGRAGGRPGIGRFKTSFGAQPREFWTIYWIRHGAGIALDLSREWAKFRTSLRGMASARRRSAPEAAESGGDIARQHQGTRDQFSR